MIQGLHVYRLENGLIFQEGESYFLSDFIWDEWLNSPDLYSFSKEHLGDEISAESAKKHIQKALPPIMSQEVWASGVTYYRSRVARMEESSDAGGGDFYDKVYDADRPELFFKANGYRVMGNEEDVFIRKDSKWNVPEPELTLVANSAGKIVAYTIGNDMSSRDIEGANPLYLPQAKVYDKSCAIGPVLFVPKQALSQSDVSISMEIRRGGKSVFEGHISWDQMKRKPEELITYLFRELSFPYGVYLMTGTGIVPPNEFSLAKGDEVHIHVSPIGTLVNTVNQQ